MSTRLEESPEGCARKYYSLTAEERKDMALMQDYLATLNADARKLRQNGVSS